MKPKHYLSIIIVSFNSKKYITQCISSLVNSKKNNEGISIFVIDNNSTDDTLEVLKNSFPNPSEINLHIIANKENLGFAAAVNQGIMWKKSQKYLLVNPDLTVKRNTLKKVLEAQQETKAGIVGIKTVDSKGNTSGSYFRFPNLFVGIFDFTNLRKLDVFDYWHNYFYYKDKVKNKNGFFVDMVTGGFMLIDAKVIEKIGLFDTSFFMYLEDIDFCLRASNFGFKTYLVNEIVTHVGGASSNNKDRIRHSAWQDSRKKYFKKHFNLITNLIIQPLFVADDFLISILKFFKNESKNN